MSKKNLETHLFYLNHISITQIPFRNKTQIRNHLCLDFSWPLWETLKLALGSSVLCKIWRRYLQKMDHIYVKIKTQKYSQNKTLKIHSYMWIQICIPPPFLWPNSLLAIKIASYGSICGTLPKNTILSHRYYIKLLPHYFIRNKICFTVIMEAAILSLNSNPSRTLLPTNHISMN